MPITVPNTDSTDQIDDSDLVLTLRESDKDDDTANYGIRAQSFSNLLPEYRFYYTTLTLNTGTDSTWDIVWDSGHFTDPEPVRIDVYSKWTQAGAGANTSWALHTYGSALYATVGTRSGGWYQVMLAGDATMNRYGHTTRATEGNVRVGSTVLDGSNGWHMDWEPANDRLRVWELGTSPFARYNVQTQLWAVTI